MSDDPWDDLPSGDYQRWTDEGEVLVGTVTSKTIGTDMNGQPCPQLGLRLDDDTERIVSASQAQLAARLKETRPKVGDRIRIAYVGTEKREGGKTLKLFEVAVKEGEPVQAPAAEDF